MTIKPHNWARTFLDHPSATGEHSVSDLLSIRNLTDSFGSEGSNPSFYRMSRELDTIYLSVGPNGKIQTFHHVDLLGDRHSPSLKAVALCSFGTQAPPIELDIDQDFVDIEVRVPNWPTLVSLTNVTDLINLSVEPIDIENDRITALVTDGSSQSDADQSRAYRFCNTNIMTVPLGLLPALFEDPSREPAELAIRFLNLMLSLDEEHRDSDGYASYRSHYRGLIRFLWAASKELIPAIPYVLSDDPTVLNWSDRIHAAYLLPRPNFPNPIPVAESDSVLAKVAHSITSLQDHLTLTQKNNKTKEEEDKEGGQGGFKKRFGLHLQQLILNASAKASETGEFDSAAPEPTPTLARFLGQSSIGGAKTFFRGHLKTNPYLDFTPSQALIVSMYTGNLTWDDGSTPINFSSFFHGRSQIVASSTSYNDQALYLKEQIGNGISETEVKQILKQERQFPQDASEAIDMIQNFLASCCFLFGADSNICKNLERCAMHLLRNKPSYDSLQRNDNSFLTQYFYTIDLAVQTHLISCLTESNRGDVNDSCLDFTQDHANILRRQFHCHLPTCLRTSDSTKTPQDKDGGGGGGGGGNDIGAKRLIEGLYKHLGLEIDPRNGKHPKDGNKKIKNPKANKDWLLKDGESYATVFYPNIKSCPTQGRQFVCLAYWIKGECKPNCKHIHGDLHAETRPKLDTWIKECRAKALAAANDAQNFR